MRRRRLGAAASAIAALVALVGAPTSARAGGPVPLAEQWHVTSSAPINEPALFRSRVIFTTDNAAAAVGLARGRRIWHTVHPDQQGFHLTLGEPTLFNTSIDAPVFTAFGAGTVTYNPLDGTFTMSGPTFHTLRGTLVVDGTLSTLVTGGFGSGVGPLQTLDFGGHTWFLNFGPGIAVGTPRLSGGRVFVAVGSSVFGIDPAQGCAPLPIPNPPPFCAPSWHTALSGFPQRPSFAGPGRVAAGDNNGVVTGLDATTGVEVWHDFFNAPQAPTTYSGGLLFVAGYEGVLRAIDAQTGAVRWTGAVGGRVNQPATVSGGEVWLATDDGRVVSFNASGCPTNACTPVGIGDSGTGVAAAGAPLVRNGVVVAAFGDELDAFATG